MPDAISPLFRTQALEFQRQHRHWGRASRLQPLSLALLVWFLCLAVSTLIAFLLLAPYARKETVQGYLMPAAGTARIYAPQPGIVSAIHVAEGQLVSEGQLLFSVATQQLAADGLDVNTAILEALRHQQATLAAQIAAEEQRGAAEARRLNSMLQGLAAEIAHIEAQMATQQERIRLTRSMVASAAQLNPRGLLSDIEYGRRELALLEQRQSLAALSQQIAARENQMTEHRSNLEQLPVVTADRLRVLRGELSGVEQRMAEVNGRRAYAIHAPVAGRVSALQATPGQSADARKLLLTILPPDALLQAELFVPTRAAGFVRSGQRVRLMYDAFPYQNFGTYGGTVARVSQAVLTSGDVAGPLELREPAYRVTAALDRPDVDAYGQHMALQPDMLLRADIILDRRPLMAWIMNPLLSAGRREAAQ